MRFVTLIPLHAYAIAALCFLAWLAFGFGGVVVVIVLFGILTVLA